MTTYVRTDVGGAYRYDTTADAWVQLLKATTVPSPHPSDYHVDAIAQAPSNTAVVYLAVGESEDYPPYPLLGRVLESTDSGATWAASARLWNIRGNAEWRYSTVRLAVHPTTPKTVLLGTRLDGLHRSTNGAAGPWTKLTTLPVSTGENGGIPLGVTCVAYDPGAAATIYAGVRGVGLCKSVDSGATWTTVHAFTTGWCKDLVVTASGTVWACFYPNSGSSQVIRLTRAGVKTTVTPSVTPRNWSSVAVDPTNDARVVLADDFVNNDGGRFMRTTNGTAATPTWTDMGLALNAGAKGTEWVKGQTGVDTGQIRFAPGGTDLWFAAGFGMWKTADLADTQSTLTFTSDGIEELVANAAVKPAGKPLITVTWDKGIWQHPDPTNPNPSAAQAARLPHVDQFGSAWDVTMSPTDPLLLAAVLDDHQDASGGNTGRKQSARSTDGGTTWTRFASLTAGTHPADLMFGNIAISAGTGANRDNMVWFPSNLPDGAPKAYYTTDGGATWTAGTLPVSAGDYLHPSHFVARRILVAHPTTPGTFYALGGRNYVNGATAGEGSAILWRTTDGGATWAKVTTTGLDRAGQYDFRFSSHLVTDGTYLYALPGKTDSTDKPFFRAALSNVGAWTEMTSLINAHVLAVGAPLAGQTNKTLWSFGRLTSAGTDGLRYSTDLGASWTLAVQNPRGLYDQVTCLAGDPEIPGRVYIGYAGNGFVVGQLPT